MLKKAGIIVAASAAGILAFTPLAFAGGMGDDGGSHHSKDDKSSSKSDKDDDGGDHHKKDDDGDHHKKDDDGDHKKDDGGDHKKDDGGDVKKDNLENDCQFGNQGGSPTAGAVGGNSLLGAASLVTSTAIDVTSQLNTLNCNNINVTDLVDSDSNNRNSSETRNSIDGSFNEEG